MATPHISAGPVPSELACRLLVSGTNWSTFCGCVGSLMSMATMPLEYPHGVGPVSEHLGVVDRPAAWRRGELVVGVRRVGERTHLLPLGPAVLLGRPARIPTMGSAPSRSASPGRWPRESRRRGRRCWRSGRPTDRRPPGRESSRTPPGSMVGVVRAHQIGHERRRPRGRRKRCLPADGAWRNRPGVDDADVERVDRVRQRDLQAAPA